MHRSPPELVFTMEYNKRVCDINKTSNIDNIASTNDIDYFSYNDNNVDLINFVENLTEKLTCLSIPTINVLVNTSLSYNNASNDF